MSFRGNQIGDIPSANFTAKNVLLTFQMKQNGMFWIILSMTSRFYTKN